MNAGRVAARWGRWLALAGATAAQVVTAPSLAQVGPKVHRVGYIQTATAEEQRHLTAAFEDAMRKLGYVEGRNVVYERRFADGRQERLPALAAELARLRVDVIVTGGNPVVAAVKEATTSIPVVMAASRDPVGAGFVASLARPGGNITGVTSDAASGVAGKHLQLLKEAIPGASRIGLLWNPLPPGADAYRREVEGAAAALGSSVHVASARGRGEFEAAFASLASARIDAMVVHPDPVFFTARQQVVALAAKHRMPAVYHAAEVVEAGGLMSYGVSLEEQFRRAADYVDQILKGAKPAELAVRQSEKPELAINLATARALGLLIPASLRLQADRLVE
jgi:putative ABC transport system substrate-binding protein